MPDNGRQQQTVWQIALLSAGLLILAAISFASVYLLDAARTESDWVVHTIETENQIGRIMLDLRSAESAVRGYLIAQNPDSLDEYDRAAADVLPAIDTLGRLTVDNPAQAHNAADFRDVAKARLNELQQLVDLAKQNNVTAAMDQLRSGSSPTTMDRILDVSTRMQKEERRLFALRADNAGRSRFLSALMTIIGAGFVVLFGVLSIFLVRRSSRERDLAEQKLRDTNLNLETIVEARTADLREANEEIQRFAYIVSHDLRSPLVNIMGFTSELEELQSEIFNRIARLSEARPDANAPQADTGEPLLGGEDKKLEDDFAEALDFIKSSIGKMDRLITAILNLTREGRREFRPEIVNMGELLSAISATVAHQAIEAGAQIDVGELPNLFSDRLALEQIFSNLIDNALKYLKPGVPGNISIRGRRKLGFAIFEVSDNGRGIDPKDHQRIFDLFRRAGTQDRPGQGIGLAHVRALVRRMGGSMAVDSKLNEGSTFIITLPLKLSTQEGHARGSAS